MLNGHKFVLKPLGFSAHKQNYKYVVSHSGCKTLKHLKLGTAYGESGRTVCLVMEGDVCLVRNHD